MNYGESILLGLVQGATEFLPISSSGHLWLLQSLFGMEPDLFFEVFLHVASLIAVIWIFRLRIWSLIKGFIWHYLYPKEAVKNDKDEGVYAAKILLATIVTAPVSIFIQIKFLENFEMTYVGVAISLLVTAVLIIGAELANARHRRLNQKSASFTWGEALLLGIFQGFAILPGISRSGMTIAFLVGRGLGWKESAEISFLLSIPTILGGFLFLMKDLDLSTFDSTQLLVWGLGAFAALVASVVAIKTVLHLVARVWIWFALYCFLLGAGILIFAN